MRVLVTGGAGFIGSHTSDALIAAGHEVTILDALRPPVHAGDRPDYLPEGARFVKGDVRDKILMTRLLSETDAVYHLAAYQDYMLDFSTFFDINATGTALIYEIIVEKKLPVQRVVVATSQAVLGEGLYVSDAKGEFLPDIRAVGQLRARRWDIVCPETGEPATALPTPEWVANPQNQYGVSKLTQEKIALSLGKRFDVPSVAMRYSIVQGPRQSVSNSYSGACRVFSLRYHEGKPPLVFEDGQSLRDYVNIKDVVDANLLVLDHPDAANRMFNVGGGKGYTTLDFARIVQRVFQSNVPPELSGEYRFGDTRHIVSDITALRALGWEPRRTPEDSVRDYREWLLGLGDVRGIVDEAIAHMRSIGVVRTPDA